MRRALDTQSAVWRNRTLTLLVNCSTLVVLAMVLATATFAAMVMLSGGVAGGDSIVGNSIINMMHF